MCAAVGIVKEATVADHVVPHKGDINLFWGPLQSLCQQHHSGSKAQQEGRRGYATDIGADGYPTDKRHPWFKGQLG